MKLAPETITLTSATDTEPVRELLLSLGEDPDREGLLRTPERMYKALQFLTRGYQEDPEEILNDALFTVPYDEMVIVKDIEMFSLCEHHVLPFFGKVHVAYIPNGKVIGLSKVPRLVDVFGRLASELNALESADMIDAISVMNYFIWDDLVPFGLFSAARWSCIGRVTLKG